MIDLTTKSLEQDMRNRMMAAKNRYYREIRRNRERGNLNHPGRRRHAAQ